MLSPRTDYAIMYSSCRRLLIGLSHTSTLVGTSSCAGAILIDASYCLCRTPSRIPPVPCLPPRTAILLTRELGTKGSQQVLSVFFSSSICAQGALLWPPPPPTPFFSSSECRVVQIDIKARRASAARIVWRSRPLPSWSNLVYFATTTDHHHPPSSASRIHLAMAGLFITTHTYLCTLF